MLTTCYICKKDSIKKLLDFGLQPISNRFLKKPQEKEFLHPLIFGYCSNCGLAQLINPPPSEEIKPHFDWIHYNEPEGHLDEVAKIVAQLPGITAQSRFCGISGKEGSLLQRLNKQGFSQTWELNVAEDLGCHDKNAGIETIQHYLNENKANEINSRRGLTDVVIARHILEHAHHPRQFMQAVEKLVNKDGYIVFEVPDCTKIFETCEYSAIWEEHTLYFTPHTFIRTLESFGFVIHSFTIYPYAMENCMVAIVKAKGQSHVDTDKNWLSFISDPEIEAQKIIKFAQQFPEKKAWYQEKLSQYAREGRLSLLGAGHLGCHFINLMGLNHFFDFVVDDHPHKKGLYMPGSQLPILSTATLEEENIKFCLLTLNQESEQKIVKLKQNFIQQGGAFFSIFSTSQLAIQ